MARGARWIDLLDPTREELVAEAPLELHERALAQLLEEPDSGRLPRPTIEPHTEYVLGVLLVAVAVEEEDRVFYQEVDFIATAETILTVRKTPPGEEPFSIETVHEACEAHGSPATGLVVYHLIDEVAERYLSLIDSLDAEVDELEEGIESWPNERIRRRLAELREDVLVIRRTLAPTRDAVRRLVDGRVELAGEDPFGRSLQLYFGEAYEKLLRATEALDVARELISSARDYHQSRISQEQNDVVRKLTVIASLLLVPTFIVGVYGQNFEHMPELGWDLGYAFSWALIAITTVLQLVFYRWRRWI
ncbi:MAG: magnesium transporter CorA family protein [Actinobacteria bacterium]|nr:magnesium transporter CorA family protein [Actinomycetota bacterium]